MANTKELYKAFQKKMQLKAPVSKQDLAVRIDNEPEALFDYMILNDLPQVWALLHASDAPFFVGHNADFFATPKRAGGELKQLLIRKDFDILNHIVGDFRINMKTPGITTDPDLINQMQQLGIIKTGADGKWQFVINRTAA